MMFNKNNVLMWWIISARFVRHQPIQYQCANSFYRRHTLFNKRTARWVEIQFGWDSERGGAYFVFYFHVKSLCSKHFKGNAPALDVHFFLICIFGFEMVAKMSLLYVTNVFMNEFFLTILSYRKRERKTVIEILRNIASLVWWRVVVMGHTNQRRL